MTQIVSFGEPEELPRLRDAVEFRFPFTVVDESFLGKPEVEARTTKHYVDVGASGTLIACWDVPRALLYKVLFEYGKRHVEQKSIDGALSEKEEIQLHTANAEAPCPFRATLIPEPRGQQLTIEEPRQRLMQDERFTSIAEQIIDSRDNFNALFHEKHNQKLLLLREERDILQLFRAPKGKEEFSYCVCALANLASNMNLDILRSVTGETDNEVKTISLLDKYLTRQSLACHYAIQVLRNINRLRQGYPVHGDRVDGVLKAYKALGAGYPVEDYENAWRTLLGAYLGAVQNLVAVLKG